MKGVRVRFRVGGAGARCQSGKGRPVGTPRALRRVPSLNLPQRDFCVTLGHRLWQGRADPASPRPHPNPLPAGEGEDLPTANPLTPKAGLCKGI